MRNLGADLERRSYKRFRRQIPCILRVAERRYPGTLVNFSEGGVFVRSGAEPRRGTKVRIDFSDLEVEAEVMHYSAPPLSLRAVEEAGIGLRFLTPTTH